MNWFISKVIYEKVMENGAQKRVAESYLVDALSFTEAEARTIEQLQPYISGDFNIADISRYPISELFTNASGDRYYKVVVAFITLDEKSGAERKTKVSMLAQASSVEEANEVIKEGMKGSMADYEIVEVKETKIMDIFPFSAK